MNTNKIDLIKAEVERLKSQLIRGACASQIAMETRCKEEAYNEVLVILDSLQEEPVSEELEEAAKLYEEDAVFYAGRNISDFFKAGAKWQREQLMAKAIDGDVTFDYYGDDDKTYGCIAHDSFCLEDFGLKDGDKVKVIVIKED